MNIVCWLFVIGFCFLSFVLVQIGLPFSAVVVFAIPFAIALLCLIAYFRQREKEKKSRNQIRYPEGCNPETTIITSRCNGWTSFYDYGTYDGRVRCIDGHPIKTPDDWDKWCVVKNHSLAIEGHLNSIKSEMEKKRKTHNIRELYSEWLEYYEKYRTWCIRYSLWNCILEEKEPFVPTSRQIDKEKRMLADMEAFCVKCEEDQLDYHADIAEKEMYGEKILAYLLKLPYHRGYRHVAIKELSTGDPELKKIVWSAYRYLLSKGTIIEKKDEAGHYLFRKAPVRKSKDSLIETETNSVALSPSVFHPGRYANVTNYTKCKARYTVGLPVDLDRSGNRCTFISTANGEKHQTSLERCTCLAYQNNNQHEPCKHMVALAIYLGHISP